MKNNLSPNFKPFPDYGDLMPLDEWKESVKSGSFIDYDGYGNLATKDQMSDIYISPSQMKKFDFPEWATHIVWFNK